jgi:catechol 2,3-dioxygenase-like lactoylglutathione lyase family enzyme
MNITYLELSSKDLPAQRDFYANILELPVTLDSAVLEIKAGKTVLRFTQAPSEFMGAYHFAFNIPENQYQSAKQWITSRVPLLQDKTGQEDFASQSWTSTSLYFLDAAGNILEFIARHNLQNTAAGEFNSSHILNVSEIGLPSEDVVALADQLCTQLGLSVFKQEPNESFTPVGDDDGLLILPVKDRIWMPDSGVPAKLLPVEVQGKSNGREWEVRGVPYEILS